MTKLAGMGLPGMLCYLYLELVIRHGYHGDISCCNGPFSHGRISVWSTHIVLSAIGFFGPCGVW